MRLTPRVAGFRSEYPAGFKLECMAGFVGTRTNEKGGRGRYVRKRLSCRDSNVVNGTILGQRSCPSLGA
jgi:hypothetical protein